MKTSKIAEMGKSAALAPRLLSTPLVNDATTNADAILNRIIGVDEHCASSAKLAVPEPERRLMLDVLRSAIEDAQGGYAGDANKRAMQQNDARAWLRDHVLTVRHCCEALGIEYSAMKKALELRWAQPGASKMLEPRKRMRRTFRQAGIGSARMKVKAARA